MFPCIRIFFQIKHQKPTKYLTIAFTSPTSQSCFIKKKHRLNEMFLLFLCRLCSLTITRLSLLSPLPVDLSSVSLAVKMQSSKRTLRSHEIPVPQSVLTANASGAVLNSPPLLETELDLNFSLQYPHFIKRDGNRLLILLQRRKKYKTRTILGYKTLAEGMIRMDAVLQKSMDMTVELSATGKGSRPGVTLATLRAERVSSIPVDHDNKNNNSVLLTGEY